MMTSLFDNHALVIALAIVAIIASGQLHFQWVTHKSINGLKQWRNAFYFYALALCFYIFDKLNPSIFLKMTYTWLTLISLVSLIIGTRLFLHNSLLFVKEKNHIPLSLISYIVLFILFYTFEKMSLNTEFICICIISTIFFINGFELIKSSQSKTRLQHYTGLIYILQASQFIFAALLSILFNTELSLWQKSSEIQLILLESISCILIFSQALIFLSNEKYERNTKLHTTKILSQNSSHLVLEDFSLSEALQYIEQKNKDNNTQLDAFLIDVSIKRKDTLQAAPYKVVQSCIKYIKSHLRQQDLVANYENNKLLIIINNSNSNQKLDVKNCVDRIMKNLHDTYIHDYFPQQISFHIIEKFHLPQHNNHSVNTQ